MNIKSGGVTTITLPSTPKYYFTDTDQLTLDFNDIFPKSYNLCFVEFSKELFVNIDDEMVEKLEKRLETFLNMVDQKLLSENTIYPVSLFFTRFEDINNCAYFFIENNKLYFIKYINDVNLKFIYYLYSKQSQKSLSEVLKTIQHVEEL